MTNMPKWGKVVAHILMILFSLACLVPFLLVVAASFTEENSLAANGFGLIPEEFSMEAYKYIFRSPEEVFSAYGTTIFITVFGTLVGTFLMSMIAYPLSRHDYKFKNVLSFFVYFTMLFGGGMVAQYILVVNVLGLNDTVWALILPLLLSPWNIMLLKMSMKSVPFALIEASYIEGAGEFWIFFKIIMPLAKVGIITIALFTALTFWNDWSLCMLYIDRSNLTTLQYMLYRVLNKVEMAKQEAVIMQEAMPEQNLRMALCVVAAGPMVFIFLFFQKYFSKGIVTGAVKG